MQAFASKNLCSEATGSRTSRIPLLKAVAAYGLARRLSDVQLCALAAALTDYQDTSGTAGEGARLRRAGGRLEARRHLRQVRRAALAAVLVGLQRRLRHAAAAAVLRCGRRPARERVAMRGRGRAGCALRGPRGGCRGRAAARRAREQRRRRRGLAARLAGGRRARRRRPGCRPLALPCMPCTVAFSPAHAHNGVYMDS